MVSRVYSYIVLYVVAVCLSGCSDSVINRGYDVTTVDFKQVKPGKHNIQDVFNMFGSPTIRSSVIHPNGDYCWYYSFETLTQCGFMKPTLKKKQLWIITFNKNNIVKSVKLSNKEHSVHMVAHTSQSGGNTKGVLKEAFGGMGKYLDKYDR